MRCRMRLIVGAAVFSALLAASPGRAVPVWIHAFYQSQNPGDLSYACAQDLNLQVCTVTIQFNQPSDRLNAVVSSDIWTTAPGGFYQSFPGYDTAPPEILLEVVPELACDSFATIGLRTVPDGVDDCTTMDEDYDFYLFNFGGQLVGGWYCDDPESDQGLAGQYLESNVLIAQLAYPEGEYAGGVVYISYNDGPTVSASFECGVVVDPYCAFDFDPCIDGDPCTNDLCVIVGGDEYGCLSEPILCAAGQACHPASGLCENICFGDLNLDFAVDAADLAILLGSWGPCPDCPADLSQDGAVDAADLALLLDAWLQCP